jgi:hypothetical protein
LVSQIGIFHLKVSISPPETALYIHKTKDKRRTEAAIDLTQSRVFIEYETPNVVGKFGGGLYLYWDETKIFVGPGPWG